MNDLEELLRTDLARAAEPIDSDLDADDLVEAGHRVRRSRAMRIGAGLTAMLVTAAGLGLVVATTVGRGAHGPVAATPLPVTSRDPSITPPSLTPSTSASPTVVDPAPAKATFDLTGFNMNKSRAPFDSMVVAANPTGSGIAITATASKPGHPDEQATSVIKPGRTSAAFLAVGKRIVVTILPGTATSGSLKLGSAAGMWGHDIKSLAAAGLTAQVTVLERGLADPTKGTEVIWQTPDGSLHSTSGAAVPSAEVAVAGEKVRVYRSEEVGDLGIWSGGTLGGTSYALKDVKPSGLIDGGLGHCGEVPPTGCTWANYTAFPPGTTNLQLTLNPKAAASGWTSVTLSDGWVVVLAVNHGNEKTSTVVLSADYVDPTGKAVHLGK